MVVYKDGIHGDHKEMAGSNVGIVEGPCSRNPASFHKASSE